jgi:hypothetical protein
MRGRREGKKKGRKERRKEGRKEGSWKVQDQDSGRFGLWWR